MPARAADYIVGRALIVLAALGVFAIPARGKENQNTAFLTPSANIACVLEQHDKPDKAGRKPGYAMRCQVLALSVESPMPERPADCDEEWSGSFWIYDDGPSGILECHGDTIFDQYPVLPYGETWHFSGGFQCYSGRAGLTCRNAAHHGFSLSRLEQRLF